MVVRNKETLLSNKSYGKINGERQQKQKKQKKEILTQRE